MLSLGGVDLYDFSRSIQQNTFDLMTACSEIERLMVSKKSTVPIILDQAVKKSRETEKTLDRLKTSLSGMDARSGSKYARLTENFSKAKIKLEETLRRYSDYRKAGNMSDDSTQLRVIKPLRQDEPCVVRPATGYEYISSMEEGGRGQTLEDLKRMNKDMTSLQDIYFSLSEVAGSQSSLIDSVQSRLVHASSSASAAVQELSRANGRMGFWTKMKIYTVTGLAAVGVLFWIF
jgi:t-SNARE complex subunit (syntaxin)